MVLEKYKQKRNFTSPEGSGVDVKLRFCLYFSRTMCVYSTPDIRFLIGFTSTNITAAETSRTMVTTRNKSCSGTVLKKPAAQPASLLPNAFDRNHTPIISPTMRRGASLVTALRPIGLTHSSPSSEMKYDQTRNHGLTRMPEHHRRG